MGRSLGRPSSYNDEIQRQADEYIYSYEELGHAIPSRAGLCCYLGISRSNSYEWEKQFPAFSDTLEAISVVQENQALNGGLTNRFNSTITKLVLANHGYSDRNAVDHTSSDGTMTPKGKSLDDFYQDVPT